MADSSVNNTFMFDALKCVWDIGKAALAVTSPPVSAGMSITEAAVTFGSGAGKNRSSKAQPDYDSYAAIFSRLMKEAFDETLKECGMEALPPKYRDKILKEVLAWDDETCIGRYRVLTLSDKYGQSSKVPEQLPLPNMVRALTLNILQARSLDIRFGSMPADLSNVDMRKASVKEAKLERAFLEGARLDEVDFHKSHLDGADLKGASMAESSLEECHLEGAVLEEADLLRAKFNEKTRLDDARLRGACMEKTKLSGTEMPGADLRGVSFIEAEISQDTVFRGADLENAILSGEQYKTIRLTEKHSRFFGLRSEQPSGLWLGLQNVFKNGRNIKFGRYPRGSDGSIEPLK